MLSSENPQKMTVFNCFNKLLRSPPELRLIEKNEYIQLHKLYDIRENEMGYDELNVMAQNISFSDINSMSTTDIKSDFAFK